MCSLPPFNPDTVSCLVESSLLRARSSRTVAAWVTVTSSSAPSAAIMVPPSSKPRTSRVSARNGRMNASSLAKPENCAASKKTQEMPRVRPSAMSVPARATVVIKLNPCVKYRLKKAIAAAATTQTKTGSFPSSTDGATNFTNTTTVTTIANSASTPRTLAKQMTVIANKAMSHHSELSRSLSW